MDFFSQKLPSVYYITNVKLIKLAMNNELALVELDKVK